MHLASIVADAAHQDVQELTPAIGTQHPVTEQFRDQSWHERPATVASSCVACGFSDDSLEHRLFACPVVGQVWETIFSDTGPTWTARAAPATALLAFYHSVHLWFVARSHVDGSLVDSSPAVWQRNVRSMLQAWWDGLASVDKTWEVAGRLLQQGVRLSSVHIPSGVGVEHGTLSHCELCALAAVSRNGLAVTIVVRRKAGCVVAPCDECSRFWECGSVHCVVPVRVGPGLVAPAGCPRIIGGSAGRSPLAPTPEAPSTAGSATPKLAATIAISDRLWSHVRFGLVTITTSESKRLRARADG